jgi:hypothetical protein
MCLYNSFEAKSKSVSHIERYGSMSIYNYSRRFCKVLYILRIPYSIIDELHEKNFKLLEQPLSADISEVNKVMEQVGFDFIFI